MRPIAINQRALRTTREQLDSARETLQSALGDVHHPTDDFPWRDLMVEGVRSLVEDAEQIAKRCRTVAGAIDDSITDFDELDVMVGRAATVAAQLDQVDPAMTRVVVDAIETQQDTLQFGDPIGCSYHWVEPDVVDAYGDSVRRLSAKVELAVDAFDRTAALSEDVFAGEAADSLRGRAGKRLEESTLVRDNLRGLGRAINAYSDVLRRHREGLEQLHALAAAQGLEVRGDRIMPPVETIQDATQKEVDAWEASWKAYRGCYDFKIELRDIRRASTRDLVRALADFADVHPDKDRATLVAAHAHQVEFGELRREAAEEAMEAVQAGDRADAAQRTVEILKRREQTALDSLERLALADRPTEEIAAQADRAAALHRELVAARSEARDLAEIADREQTEAHRAARHLADAESGTPRAEDGQMGGGPAPTPGLRDRLS